MERHDKKNPLISVIIPVYNAESTLEECVRSVRMQSYENLQIILVDDGSTDGSLAMCRKNSEQDSRIEVLHKTNGGPQSARREGVAIATGDYIGFVDSDDYIHERMFEYLLQIQQDSESEISSIEMKTFYGNNRRKTSDSGDYQVVNRDDYLDIFFKIGSQRTVYYLCNKLYRRDLIKPEMFREDFLIGGDVLTQYRALLGANRIAVSTKRMYFYRKNHERPAKFRDGVEGLADVWNGVVAIAKEFDQKHLHHAEVNRKRINFTILSEYALMGLYRDASCKAKIEDHLEELKRVKKELLAEDIAVSRKVMISAFCINYRISAMVIHALRHKLV